MYTEVHVAHVVHVFHVADASWPIVPSQCLRLSELVAPPDIWLVTTRAVHNLGYEPLSMSLVPTYFSRARGPAKRPQPAKRTVREIPNLDLACLLAIFDRFGAIRDPFLIEKICFGGLASK